MNMFARFGWTLARIRFSQFRNPIMAIARSTAAPHCLLVSLLALLFTSCSDSNTQSAPAQPPILSSPHGSTAIFGYSDDGSRVFTQYVKAGGAMGPELLSWAWQDTYQSMTSFRVGNRYFAMGLSSDTNFWFVQELLPTGDLGSETQRGQWNNYYRTLTSFQLDENGERNTYIFGQRGNKTDAKYHWFIQRINSDGKMGNETDNGFWYNYYGALAALQVYENGKLNAYIFGQEDDKSDKGYRWFLQPVKAGGKMGANESDNGHWQNYYPTVAPLQINESGQMNTYIFGQQSNKTDGKYHWFIQRINAGGKMGGETDSGYWHNYYPTVAPLQINESGQMNAYIFGQQSDTNTDGGYSWFIQRIHAGGKMGDETNSGYWGHYYPFVFPFHYDAAYASVDGWMGRDYGILQDKRLTQIVLPGSHDTGMSTAHTCSGLASSCNTVTQLQPIAGQLNDGIRYFDIRPVKDSQGDWWTGHFASDDSALMLGCMGEDLETIFTSIKSFLDGPNHKDEFVILDFSHLVHMKSRTAAKPIDDALKNELAQLLQSYLGDYLFKCDNDCSLMGLTLDQFINPKSNSGMKAGRVLVLIRSDMHNKSQGMFSYDDLYIYGGYSGTNDLGRMIDGQTQAFVSDVDHAYHLFLLSWTLTQSTEDVMGCKIDAAPSIIDLARKANATLFPTIQNLYNSGQITRDHVPNILQPNISSAFVTRAAIWLNRDLYR